MLTVVTPATVTRLATLAQARAVLAMDASTDDLVLEMVERATGALEVACGRSTFARETVTESWRIAAGTYRRALPLERDIAAAVTAVSVDGIGLTSAEYEVDGALLYRLDLNGARVIWCGRIIATYAGGLDLTAGAPPALRGACLTIAQAYWAAIGRDPLLRSESVPDVLRQDYFSSAESGGGDGLPGDVSARIAPWRRVVV